MPFLKIEQKSSGTYQRIVESYRDETGKNRPRILHSLGNTADYTPEQLRAIGIKLFELGGELKALKNGAAKTYAMTNLANRLFSVANYLVPIPRAEVDKSKEC